MTGGSRAGPAQGGGARRAARHVPVMLRLVLDALQPKDGATYIDATFGAGGYTSAILEAADCRVIALDRDPAAVVAGFELALAYQPRLKLLQAPFSMLSTWAANPVAAIPGPVDGVVFDLGVSSMQLDEAGRGFSFQADGPLDMRMFAAPGQPVLESGPSAADLVNQLDEAALADVLYQYGEERRSRAIARAIVAEREAQPFTRTRQLAELVERVLGRRRGDPIHPATRTFQALRIAVNGELRELARGLSGAEHLLRPGGRLVAVAFHSLEDRIVKRFLAERCGRKGGASRHLPVQQPAPDPSFRILNQRPLAPDNDEVAANPRARSAKLRAAERTAAPALALDEAGLGLPDPGLA